VLDFGTQIAQQLGEAAEYNLLAAWMSKYLGEKILDAKKAKGKQRQVLEKECIELIFKLWDYRHKLPNGARPLESFEPVFDVLNELDQKHPRYKYLHYLPRTNKNSEIGKIMKGVLEIDELASEIILNLIAEAIRTIPKKDKQWASIRAIAETEAMDIVVVRLLLDGSKSTLDKKEEIKKQERANLEGLLKKIGSFEKSVTTLRVFIEKRIKSIK